MDKVEEIFMKLVQFPTASQEDAASFPSTKTQLDFAAVLVQLLKETGIVSADLDDHGYVYAHLPSNQRECKKSIGWLAHMDTAPEFLGEHIKPRKVVYTGEDIVLNEAEKIFLTSRQFPELDRYLGKELIVTDGITLLGADDKAGVAEIISALSYFLQHPEIKRPHIYVCFTPDEEVGAGTDFINLDRLTVDFALTVDGGGIGEFNYENFNAASAEIEIRGVSVHPGWAKDIMKNAVLIGNEIIAMLPKIEAPAETSGYEGFYHVAQFHGNVEHAELRILIREFDKQKFEDRKKVLQDIVEGVNKKYGALVSIHIKDQYYNMGEQMAKNLHIIELAKSAMEKCGIEPQIVPVRGGTDGAQLTYKGLVCPNLFTGGHNAHGPYEYIPVFAMEKAVETIVAICELYAAM